MGASSAPVGRVIRAVVPLCGPYSIPVVADARRADVAAALANGGLKRRGHNVTAKPGRRSREHALTIVHGLEWTSRCGLTRRLELTGWSQGGEGMRDTLPRGCT